MWPSSASHYPLGLPAVFCCTAVWGAMARGVVGLGRRSCPRDSSPAKAYKRQFPGDLAPGGRSIPLTSPGSMWQAWSPPWSRHLSGRRYSSFALATLPRSSRQGGRKMARPSSLIGGCKTAVPSLWEKAGSSSFLHLCVQCPLLGRPLWHSLGGSGLRGLWGCLVFFSFMGGRGLRALSPEICLFSLHQVPVTVRWLPHHQPLEARGCRHL